MKSQKKDFRVLSDHHCLCGARLKQNLIDKKPNARHCYNCYQREVRKNPDYMRYTNDKGFIVNGKHYNSRKAYEYKRNAKGGMS